MLIERAENKMFLHDFQQKLLSLFRNILFDNLIILLHLDPTIEHIVLQIPNSVLEFRHVLIPL